MLQVWKKGAQEMGVSTNERKKERGGGTAAQSIEKSKGTL